MIPRRVVRELERQLTREPGNLTVRVTLAAAYRELGRSVDAVEQYRLVAGGYLEEGRVDEALAACTSGLAITADDRELQTLQGRVQAAHAARRAAAPPTPTAPTATGRKPLARSASSSMTDVETPLPPPVALHDTGDSLIGLPRNVVDSGIETAERRGSGPPSPLSLPPPPPALPPLPPLPALPAPPAPPPRTTMMGPAATPARTGGSYSGPLPRVSSPVVPTLRAGAVPRGPRAADQATRPGEHPTRPLDRPGAPGSVRSEDSVAFRALAREDDVRRRLEPVSDPSMEILVELDSDPAVDALNDRHEAPETLPADDLSLLDVAQPVVALTEVRRAGERPADLAAELATRRRPRLSPHELELLDLEVLGGLAAEASDAPGPEPATSDAGVANREVLTRDPALSHSGIELPDTALDTPALPPHPTAAGSTVGPMPSPPGDFVDDEPTQPPEPGREHPISDRHVVAARARDGHVEGDGGTFAGGFTGTLAELAPDGSAVDGPLGVFSMLPPDAANELARRAVVKLFDDGETVVREGEVGDACFVIARGEVVVTRGAPGEPVVELARLGEGALFGEFALLADRRRHATVTALGETEIYVIPRLLLRELAAVFPDVGPALERFYRERLLANLIQTSPLFARLALDQRAGLLTAFEPMRVESGQAIVRQGERAGGLFLIVLGAVEVVCRTDDRRAVVLATLGEGAYVGEISLLTGDVATASVLACGPVELAALPAKAFYRVVSEYPELWTAMRDEADARRLRTARLLAGRTGVV